MIKDLDLLMKHVYKNSSSNEEHPSQEDNQAYENESDSDPDVLTDLKEKASKSFAPHLLTHIMENEDRIWMYNRLYPNRAGLREEYKAGVAEFNYKAMTLNEFLIEAKIRCPCWNCKCCKLLSPDAITLHFYRKGFMLNYTVWTAHEESSAANNFALQNYIENPIRENNVESSRYSEMVRDAFGTHSGTQNEPNDEANHFYE
ncbi:hypothetical protein CQW23_25876 [Capsicum baccatum]|uniref:Transposase-associated domain-containing protein n=1 Tax=Capsicum baccatum TaxID=33114 RepID=A0A2G2VM76_CAPBA|nr:hypothetical protein CQW23_25876 [Capsicum baccatum]